MNAEDLKVDLNELKEFKRKNAEDRLKFIDFWVDYIKNHDDKDWSGGQAMLIDSQIEMSRSFAKNFREAKKKS